MTNSWIKLLRNLTALLAALEIVLAPFSANAAPPAANSNLPDTYMVQKEDSNAKSGSVYVTPTKKNEVLFRASIWGAVQYPGAHYLPIGTRLLEALSLAGGPTDRADLDHLKLSHHEGSEIKVSELSVTGALASNDLNPVLKPDDVLLIREDRTTEKVSMWLQIGTVALSVITLGLLIRATH